jgi:hypothetical protein
MDGSSHEWVDIIFRNCIEILGGAGFGESNMDYMTKWVRQNRSYLVRSTLAT